MHNRQVEEIWRMRRGPAIYINHKLILLFLYHFPFLSCWTMSKTLASMNKELKKKLKDMGSFYWIFLISHRKNGKCTMMIC